MPHLLPLLNLPGLTPAHEDSASFPESSNDELSRRQFDLKHFSSQRNGKILILHQSDEFETSLYGKRGTSTSMVAYWCFDEGDC